MRISARMLLILTAFIVISLGSCVEPRNASMTNLRLTSDSAGNVPTMVYSPTDVIYAYCDLTDATSRTRVEVKLRAVAVEGFLPDEIVFESGFGVFSNRYYTGPYGVTIGYGPAWPLGLYEADYFLDGTFIEGIPFSVR